MLLFSSSTAASIFRSSSLSPVTKRHGESRILRTHPLHLFRIIQDVDKYQDFLPLCRQSQVLTVENQGRRFDAKLMVGVSAPGGLFSEEYVSRVTVIPEMWRVETESTDCQRNMFDSLKSSWQLRRMVMLDTNQEIAGEDECISADNKNASDSRSQNSYQNIGCHVDFEVEMTVSNPAVVAMLDKVLMQVAGCQVEAFDKRCQELPWPLELIEQVERQGYGMYETER